MQIAKEEYVLKKPYWDTTYVFDEYINTMLILLSTPKEQELFNLI
jgi:hypothetical protein